MEGQIIIDRDMQMFACRRTRGGLVPLPYSHPLPRSRSMRAEAAALPARTPRLRRSSAAARVERESERPQAGHLRP